MRRFIGLMGLISVAVAGCGGGGEEDPTYVPPSSLAGYMAERLVIKTYMDPVAWYVPDDASGAWLSETLPGTSTSRPLDVRWYKLGTHTDVAVNDQFCIANAEATFSNPLADAQARAAIHGKFTDDGCNLGLAGLEYDSVVEVVKRDASGAPTVLVSWLPEAGPAEARPDSVPGTAGGAFDTMIVCPKDAVLGDAGCKPYCYWAFEGDPYVDGGGPCPTTMAELIAYELP